MAEIKVYRGPDLEPVRTIVKGGGWVDDPDWFGDLTTPDPSDAIMWGIDGIRRRTGGVPLTELGIYFCMHNASGVQVAATADIRAGVFNKPSGFGITDQSAKYVRSASTAQETNYDLIDPYVVSVGRHPKMVLRVSNIVSATGVTLYIALQEIR